jgi:hypothetical protein
MWILLGGQGLMQPRLLLSNTTPFGFPVRGRLGAEPCAHLGGEARHLLQPDAPRARPALDGRRSGPCGIGCEHEGKGVGDQWSTGPHQPAVHATRWHLPRASLGAQTTAGAGLGTAHAAWLRLRAARASGRALILRAAGVAVVSCSLHRRQTALHAMAWLPQALLLHAPARAHARSTPRFMVPTEPGAVSQIPSCANAASSRGSGGMRERQISQGTLLMDLAPLPGVGLLTRPLCIPPCGSPHIPAAAAAGPREDLHCSSYSSRRPAEAI